MNSLRKCEVFTPHRRNPFLPPGASRDRKDPIIGIRLLDVGRYDENSIIWEETDYMPCFLTVSGRREHRGETAPAEASDAGGEVCADPEVRTFLVMGGGLGDGLTMAYAWMRAEGLEEDFRVLHLEDTGWDENWKRTWQEVVIRGDVCYDLLKKLDPNTARLISNLIDVIVSRTGGGTEKDLYEYEFVTLPRRSRYIGEDTDPSQKDLIDRRWKEIYYDRTKFEVLTWEGFHLCSWLEDDYRQASEDEARKKCLCCFLQMDYDCSFLWTAFRMVMDDQVPPLGTLTF